MTTRRSDSPFGLSPLLWAAVLAAACRGAGAPAEARNAVPDGEVRMAPDAPQRTSIAVEAARLATERVVATLPAQVVPDEDHTVRVTSPVVGHVTTLLVRAGDHVRAGQALAQLWSPDAAQATSDGAKAFTAWRTSRATLARATDLYEHKVIAARDLEQARNDEAQTRAEYERTRARARQLGLGASGVSDAFVLRAPMSGVVIDRTVNSGAEVRPENGQPLLTISSLDTVWLAVGVPQRDLAHVHRGARIRFTTEAVPGTVFEARVSFVSDALDPVSRTATVRAVLPNVEHRLHVQTTGEARLLATSTVPAVMIPARALVTHGTETVVFVEASPGRFLRRTVTVSDDDGTAATITSGLAAGERVVTTGSLLLAAQADRAK